MRRILWLIGPVVLVGVLLFAVLAARSPASSTAFTLRPGDCFDIPGDTQIGDIATLDCGTSHDAEVFVVGPLVAGGPSASVPDPYPGGTAISEWVANHCGPDAIRAYAGQAASASLAVGYFYPDENAWGRGERQLTCYLHGRDNARLTAPLRTSAASAAAS